MQFTFKVGGGIKKSWGFYKENLGNIILFLVFMFVLSMVMNTMLISTVRTFSIASVLVFNVLSAIVGLFFAYLWVKSSLDMIDGRGFNPFSKDSFLNFSKFWNFIKTNILIGICVMLPSFVVSFISIFFLKGLNKNLFIWIILLLIAFYTYVMVRLFPAVYLSVDKNQGARKSFAESWNLTKGSFLPLLGSFILIFLFTISGILALFIGLFITYPVGLFVVALMYRELSKGSVSSSPEVISETVEPSKVEVKEEVVPEKIEEVKPEVVSEESK